MTTDGLVDETVLTIWTAMIHHLMVIRDPNGPDEAPSQVSGIFDDPVKRMSGAYILGQRITTTATAGSTRRA